MLLLLLSHLSYPTLCDPVDCTLPGSSVPVIFPAKILEWVGMLSSRGSSQPRDWTPCLQHLLHCRWTLYHWATREAQKKFKRVTNWKVWNLFRSQLKPQTYIYIYTHIYMYVCIDIHVYLIVWRNYCWVSLYDDGLWWCLKRNPYFGDTKLYRGKFSKIQ